MLLALSIISRLPAAMLSIGLLVHTQRVTGSFAAAGVVSAAYAAALGTGGPVLGRLVDRRGQTAVLLGGAVACAVALAGAAALGAGAPLAVLVALAGAAGVSMPPVGACLRTLLPAQLGDPGAVRAAFAAEATAVELTWVAGPPLILAAGHALSTGAALAGAGALLAVATAAFAAQPASRAWRPPGEGAGERSHRAAGALAAPAVRTLVLALLALGVVFGAVEVAVAAAGGGSAGALLALWGAGSLLGGAVASRRGGGARTPTGLALLLVALAAGHLALALAPSTALLALGLTVAGTTIAPTYASVYAMVEEAAPAGTITEAFAWLSTAVAAGAAAGAAAAGALIDSAGPTAAFALAGVAGALAALTVARRQAAPALAPA